MKDIFYAGDSLKIITGFPDKAKQRILALLDGIKNEVPPHPKEFKYIPMIGSGVYELRVKINMQYRVFYVAKFAEGIYVLHAFVKKTQKTSKQNIAIGIRRYKAIINYERENEH